MRGREGGREGRRAVKVVKGDRKLLGVKGGGEMEHEEEGEEEEGGEGGVSSP